MKLTQRRMKNKRSSTQNLKSMITRSNYKSVNAMKVFIGWALLILLTTGTLTTAQAQSGCVNSALVCNNLVRVSLDTSCTALITPDVVLKGQNIDTSLYRVEVRDPDGNIIPGALIMDDYDGAHLEVRVYCEANNLYCWGYIIVEDKIKPIITVEPQDTTLKCNVMPFELDANALVTNVSFTDNGCVKPDTFSITDFTEEPFPCRDTVKIIRRVFTTFDAAGNRCDTTQTIYLLKAELSDIVFPRDTTIDCLDEADLSPAKLGMPEFGVCDHFEVGMQDVEIPVCGVARKILRRWTVTDNCDNRDTIVTQVIKIEDNNPPKFNFDNFDIPIDRVETDKFNCTASVIGINNPQITDCNLAQTTLTIFYQFADENGVLFGQLFQATVNDMLSDPVDPMTATMVWDLLDVPVGQDFRVIFVADDGCGNISRDTSAVFNLPDTSPPNAVCEGNTTVVLNDNGETKVWAESFDDNSFDNCGVVSRLVRRFDDTCPGYANETQFGDFIHFCCSDVVNNPVKVVFRVLDASGGFSDCIVNAYVQDKRPVSITCGADYNFNCGMTREDIVSTIENRPPDVVWVCGEKSLTVEIPDYIEDECGGAQFTVTWTAMDLNGQMATCTENVTIGNLDDAMVIRPDLQITLSSCNGSTHPDNIPNSRPTVNNVDCENINITWEDEFATGTGSECFKIIRTWSIIDWCQFDGGNLSSGLLDQFEQTITVNDNTAPVINGFDDVILLDAGQNCEMVASFSIGATDDCTPSDMLNFSYSINIDGGSTELGLGSAGSFVFPVGNHVITYTVSDQCGNTATETSNVIVTSSKAPIPLCISLVEAIIGNNGQATVDAADLNVKSTNGCTDSEAGLTFAFSQDGSVTTATFDCTDIPNGIFDETTIDLWVIDANGNSASCNVIVTISDRQNNVCADNVSASVISGNITDEGLSAVANVPVRALDMSSGTILTTNTDDDGNYAFDNLIANNNYEVSPELEGYTMAGISTLDLVLIQQHILNIRPFESPYKWLAADVNNSNSISAVDLVVLRQLILGIRTQLPEDSWKFVDRDYEFDMNQGPWTYLDHIMVYDALPLESDKNFIALKVGDVTGEAFTALALGEVDPRSTKVVEVRPERRNNHVRYHFATSGMEDVIGLQMAITLPEGTHLGAIGSNILNLGDDHFGVVGDELRISWSASEGVTADEEELFFIDLQVTGDEIPTLALSHDFVSAEIYDETLERSAIAFKQIDGDQYTGFELLQNQPNPFTDETTITFNLPENGTVEFRVTDLNGQTVHNQSAYFRKGANQIRIDSGALGGSGIYYYTLTTATDKKTMRMILLH